MKKILTVLMIAIIAIAAVACTESVAVDSKVLESNENVLAIEVDGAAEKATLLNAMKQLKQAEQITFEITADGFITSINGKAGAADYSSFWALYTTDAENSNPDWGTYEFDGKTLASATLGAESLKVKAGEFYVWVFTEYTF